MEEIVFMIDGMASSEKKQKCFEVKVAWLVV